MMWENTKYKKYKSYITRKFIINFILLKLYLIIYSKHYTYIIKYFELFLKGLYLIELLSQDNKWKKTKIKT